MEHVLFLMQLGLALMKFFQDEVDEPNAVKRRMNQIIEFNQIRESLDGKNQAYKDKIKAIFDKKGKVDFFIGYMVLRWDAIREEKGKHGKYDNLWFGPFQVAKV